eukprot:COSAG06_NODE_45844_length_351_cov_1.230159_1_plen_83_part_10
MLMSLRKDRGTSADVMPCTRAKATGEGFVPSDGFVRVPVTYADSASTSTGPAGEEADGDRVELLTHDALGRALGKIDMRSDTD